MKKKKKAVKLIWAGLDCYVSDARRPWPQLSLFDPNRDDEKLAPNAKSVAEIRADG